MGCFRWKEFRRVLFMIAMANWWRSQLICERADNFWKCWGWRELGKPSLVARPWSLAKASVQWRRREPDSSLRFATVRNDKVEGFCQRLTAKGQRPATNDQRRILFPPFNFPMTLARRFGSIIRAMDGNWNS